MPGVAGTRRCQRRTIMHEWRQCAAVRGPTRGPRSTCAYVVDQRSGRTPGPLTRGVTGRATSARPADITSRLSASRPFDAWTRRDRPEHRYPTSSSCANSHRADLVDVVRAQRPTPFRATCGATSPVRRPIDVTLARDGHFSHLLYPLAGSLDRRARMNSISRKRDFELGASSNHHTMSFLGTCSAPVSKRVPAR